MIFDHIGISPLNRQTVCSQDEKLHSFLILTTLTTISRLLSAHSYLLHSPRLSSRASQSLGAVLSSSSFHFKRFDGDSTTGWNMDLAR